MSKFQLLMNHISIPCLCNLILYQATALDDLEPFIAEAFCCNSTSSHLCECDVDYLFAKTRQSLHLSPLLIPSRNGPVKTTAGDFLSIYEQVSTTQISFASSNLCVSELEQCGIHVLAWVWEKNHLEETRDDDGFPVLGFCDSCSRACGRHSQPSSLWLQCHSPRRTVFLFLVNDSCLS